MNTDSGYWSEEVEFVGEAIPSEFREIAKVVGVEYFAVYGPDPFRAPGTRLVGHFALSKDRRVAVFAPLSGWPSTFPATSVETAVEVIARGGGL